MATLAISASSLSACQLLRSSESRTHFYSISAFRSGERDGFVKGLSYKKPGNICPKNIFKPIPAVCSGLKGSIKKTKDNVINIKDAQVVLKSQEGNKIELRVDLPGKETQKVFSKVIANMASEAPPIPGFRREKGGKTSKVPTDFLLQILGEERVKNFVIQEIVVTTIANYVEEESLNIKDNETKTVETAEELKASFSPGKEFGFSALLELENPENAE